MVDRYAAYPAMQQVKDSVILLAFCWAHVRRDFIKVGGRTPLDVSRFLLWILSEDDREKLGEAMLSAG